MDVWTHIDAIHWALLLGVPALPFLLSATTLTVTQYRKHRAPRGVALPQSAGEWLCVMEPMGVVLNIAPWNAPVLLSVLPVVGALAAGNCCVIKPPEAAPASSALLAEIIAASLAPEAVTVVQGDAAVCERLIDAGFDHIMFTGGTAIGKLVMARAAKTLTPVTLERIEGRE